MSNPEQIWICPRVKCGCITKESSLLVIKTSAGISKQCPECKSEDICEEANLQCPDCEQRYNERDQDGNAEQWGEEGQECPGCKNDTRFDRYSTGYNSQAKRPTLIRIVPSQTTFPKP